LSSLYFVDAVVTFRFLECCVEHCLWRRPCSCRMASILWDTIIDMWTLLTTNAPS
jgi:hypothetical protein